MAAMHINSARAWLETEYLQRRERNPRYSLRSFAKTLGIPSGRLSQLLAAKRNLTPKSGAQIADALGWSPKKRTEFLDKIAKDRAARRASPVRQGASRTPQYEKIELDRFEVISDPLHFAILSLMEVEGFRSDVKWIAYALGKSVVEVRRGLERLQSLRLIEIRDDQIMLSVGKLSTGTDIPSGAIRNSHKIAMRETIEAMDEIAVELRDLSLMTLAIDPAKIPEAKDLLRDMRHQVAEMLESGQKQEVYRLQIQLVPVTKGDS